MTTINTSSDIGTELIVLPSNQFRAHTFVGGSGHYPTPKLLAALGVDKLGCGCDQADENLKVALNRAEAAEAEALEQAKLVRTWVDRAEKAEALALNWERMANTHLEQKHAMEDKLAEAEATIERVKAAVADLSCGCARDAVSDALGLTPSTPLPIEPGSVILIDADVTQTRAGIPAACQRDGRFRALDGSAGGWDRDTHHQMASREGRGRVSTQRDDLVRDLEAGGDWITGSPEYAADVLLERGWTKPRTVTTAEELAALPLKSVILSDGGDAWQKEFTGLHGYTWMTYARHMDSRRAASTLLPATVLHEGAQ